MSGRESGAAGRWGEELAARYLEKQGYSIVARNWRCRFGELDLVAQCRKYLCFVEVKLRRGSAYGSAGEAVTWSKQQKLRAAAELYLVQYPTELQPRFDVVEVHAPQGKDTKAPVIRLLENAF